jgi:subtilisin family serine protease
MTEPRRVIVELRHSAGRDALAANVASGAATPHLDTDVVPSISGLSWDLSYPPVELPGRIALGEPSSPFDVGPRFSLDLEPANSTYLVRASLDAREIDTARAAAERNAAVVGIFADVAVQPCLICPGSPPMGTDQDVERLLCVPKLRKCGMDGSGVLVAIVDTGVNMAYLNSHGKNPTFDLARSWTPVAGLVPGSLPVNHGTMCAFDTCIAAPNCTLLDIALLQSGRTGRTVMEGFLSDGVLAYRHLLDIMLAPKRPGESRSMVVNNSWGMFHPSWDFPVGDPGNYSDNPNHPFNRIVGALERAGADILFAAGNCGPDCPDGRCQGVTANAIYGANSHPLVLSIAGVDTSKARVGYSSVGPGRLAQQKPDLSSYTHFKGSGVYAADGGTSAATPVATGVVAALRSRLPYDTALPQTSPAAVRNLLIKTAEDVGLLGYDYEYGWGIVDGCRLADKLCKDDKCEKCLECCRECCKKCCKKCCGDGDLADLVPIPDEHGSFCRRSERGLTVTVCNKGAGPAGPSTTTVDFGQYGRVDVPTPALAAGACVDVTAPIPPNCFDPDCEFRIIVDSTGVVAESDEGNNTASGTCLG